MRSDSPARALGIVVCLAGALFLHPAAVPMADDLRRMLAWIGQVAVALTAVYLTGKKAPLLVPIAWVLASRNVPDELAVVAWTLCASSCLQGAKGTRNALVVVAAVEGALMVWGVDQALYGRAAELTASALGLDVGRGIGPTYLFTRPLVYLGAVSLLESVWRRSGWGVGATVLSVVGCAWFAASGAVRASAELDTMPNWGVAGAALGSLAIPTVLSAWRRSEAESRVAFGVPVLAICFGSLVGELMPRPPLRPDPARVVFLNEGGLDWDVPVWGKYQGFSGGMFGCLPHALSRAGFDTRAESWETALEQLDQCDVLVTINNPRIINDAARVKLEVWLQQGGAMLVLGDHTNVFGLQKGFNSLLEPWGCRFEFDSAYAEDGHWSRRIDVRRPLTMNRLRSAFLPHHAVGASLTVDSTWHRLLEGVFGFSDDGEPYNVPGAYLGNYKFDSGEPLGNLTLAAWRPMGRGVVVAYGDTSAFQNGSLEQTFLGHVLPMFRWMAADQSMESARRSWIGVLLCVVVIVGVLRGAWLWSRPWVGGLPLVALVMVGARVTTTEAEVMATIDLSDAVLVDRYSLPNIGHYEARWNSIGGLTSNAQRCGYWALDVNERVPVHAMNPAAWVMVGPQRRLSEELVQQLEAYERSGGTVILACGYADAAAVTDYLQGLGAGIGDQPLGRVHSREHGDRTAPQFWDAWPLRLPDRHTVVARAGEQCVMAYIPRGTGGCLLIGDTRYFCAANLEDISFVHVGNTALVNQALQQFVRPARTRLAPIAGNPVKPE